MRHPQLINAINSNFGNQTRVIQVGETYLSLFFHVYHLRMTCSVERRWWNLKKQMLRITLSQYLCQKLCALENTHLPTHARNHKRTELLRTYHEKRRKLRNMPSSGTGKRFKKFKRALRAEWLGKLNATSKSVFVGVVKFNAEWMDSFIHIEKLKV